MSELPAPSLIAELELRQDEALLALTELEQQIEAAMAAFGVSPVGASKRGKKHAAEQSEVSSVDSAALTLHAAESDSQPAAA